MKQFLFWCFALLFSTSIIAQKQSVFEQVELHQVLPKIAKFYDTNFSYADAIIENKKVSIVLDTMIALEDLILTLSAQTDLKFEQLSPKNIVISPFKTDDLITVCGQLQCNSKTIANAVIQINNNPFNIT